LILALSNKIREFALLEFLIGLACSVRFEIRNCDFLALSASGCGSTLRG
jgi:hypothetical protein